MDINIVKIKGVKCEACERQIQVVCFWFGTLKAQEQYLHDVRIRNMGSQNDLFGEFLPMHLLVKFPWLFGKFVGFQTHDCTRYSAKRKNHACDMSGKPPQNEAIIAEILKKVEQEEKNPAVNEHKDNQIAKKRVPERNKEWGNKQIGMKRNVDLYGKAEVGAEYLRRKFGISKPDGLTTAEVLDQLQSQSNAEEVP